MCIPIQYMLALSCFCQHTTLYIKGALEKCPSSFDNINETRNLRAKGWPTYFLPTKREHGKVKVILSRYKRKSIFKIPKLPMTPNNIWRWTCFLSAVFLKAAAYWKWYRRKWWICPGEMHGSFDREEFLWQIPIIQESLIGDFPFPFKLWSIQLAGYFEFHFKIWSTQPQNVNTQI